MGIALRRVGSGKRLTFTQRGEEILSDWMADNALVTWAETADPWLWEDRALKMLDFPLNLSGNSAHRLHGVLTPAR